MRTLLLLLMLSVLIASPIHALGPRVGQEQTQEITQEKEKARGLEKTKEKRKTEGRREERRITASVSRELRDAVRSALSFRGLEDYMVDVNLADVLRSVTLELEREGIEPFGSCRLLSAPPSLTDLGLRFGLPDGGVDLLALEYQRSRARGWETSPVKEKKIRKLVGCALAYAEILASAELELLSWVRAVGEDWLGVADLRRLARVAVTRAIRDPDPGIRALVEKARGSFHYPCRFRGEMETVRCGGLDVSIRPTFTVHLKESEIYGQTFFGIRAHLRLSTAFALDQAWERVKAESEGERNVRDLVDYVEKLEARGEIARASMLKKKALRQLERGRLDLTLSPLP